MRRDSRGYSTYKRSGNYTYGRNVNSKYDPRKKRRTQVQSMELVPVPPQVGFTRTVGNYRFQAPGNTELKWFDTTLAATQALSTGTILIPSINLLTAGTGESQVIGRKCVIKRIQMRFSTSAGFLSASSGADILTDSTFRLMVILDRQANGAAATIADIFQDNDIRGFNNLANSLRFRVLRDVQYTFEREGLWNGTNYVSLPINVVMDPIYLKVDIPLEFGATPAASINDVRSNNILVAAFASDDSMAFTIRTRIRYDDK